MESTPRSTALLHYLTTLHDTAAKEIESRKPVGLEAQDTPEVVPPLIDVTVTVSPTDSGQVPEPSEDAPDPRIFASLSEAFTHHSGQLVLLGSPGAGKTTTLWMFARERADDCLADPTLPLPIFLKIDTWNRKTPIAAWVRSQMPELPLQNIPLLYLCDGLDELGGERPVDPAQSEGECFDPRAEFLRLAEAQFMGCKFVISCRSAEYEEIRSKMHGCGAATLLPLNAAKIEQFLTSWDRPHLWEMLRDDASLMEFARTPLLLSLLCSAVGAEKIDPKQDLHYLNESALFRYYFDRRFVHEERKFQAHSPGLTLPFDKATTRQVLGRLALYMWHWPYDPLTALERIEARFHLGEYADAFLAFACRMHFLRESPDGHIAFIHLKFRDFCVVPALQQALANRSFQVQRDTVTILAQLKEQGVPTLVEALEQSEVKVRQAIAKSLAQLAMRTDPATQEAFKQAIPALLRVIDDRDSTIRSSLLSTLVRSGSPAVPALLQTLQREGAAIRWETASMIAWTSAEKDHRLHEALPHAIPVLLEALKNSDRNVRSHAASALEALAKRADPLEFDSPLAPPPLEIFESDAGYVRAVEYLQALKSSVTPPERPTDLWLQETLIQTIPILMEALKEEDDRIQRDVISALVHLRAQSLPAILPVFRDIDRKVRQAAISVLIQTELPLDPAISETLLQSVPALLPALHSRDTKILQPSLWDISSLTRLAAQAVPAFLEAMKGRSVKVQQDVVSSLAILEGPLLPVLMQALQARDFRVRRLAVIALAGLQERTALSFRELNSQIFALLLTALKDQEVRVRREVLSAFIFFEERAIPALLQALQDSDTEVQKKAASSLADLEVAAFPALLQALQQEEIGVRRMAASSLMEMNMVRTSVGIYPNKNPALLEVIAQAVPTLLKALQDRDARVRLSILSVFAQLGEQADPLLMEMLRDENFRVRRHTVEILGQRRSVIPTLLRLLQTDHRATRWAALAALSRHGYVPRLALRPRLHVTLHHSLTSHSSAVCRLLLALQMKVSFLQEIPILPSEPGE